MNLDTIRNFEWYNEPEFSLNSGMLVIKASSATDFWQDKHNNIKKDDGHFFFIKHSGDFELTVKWQKPEKIQELCQFGLLGRIDEQNWCKISAMQIQKEMFLFLSVTYFGVSDSVIVPLTLNFNTISYRLYYNKGVFSLSYSLDGQQFKAIRHFQMFQDFDNIDIGAYICNPNTIEPISNISYNMEKNGISNKLNSFQCELLDIDINHF